MRSSAAMDSVRSRKKRSQQEASFKSSKKIARDTVCQQIRLSVVIEDEEKTSMNRNQNSVAEDSQSITSKSIAFTHTQPTSPYLPSYKYATVPRGFSTFVMDSPNRSNELSYNDEGLENNLFDTQDSSCLYDSTLCYTDKPKRKAKPISRRHTLGGPHGQSQEHHLQAVRDAIAQRNLHARTPQMTLYAAPGDKYNSLSRRDAEQKRAALFHYLERVYPQHADVIAGRHRPIFSHAAASSHTRASYSPSEASSLEPLIPAYESAYPGFARGCRLRASLPIVRSDSRIRDRPRVVYLQYNGETKAAHLPPELTSLDTIRALFVQSYQGLLTMPVLDKQRHAIMLKNTKNGKFEEIDNVKRIKDRSFIRARPRDGNSGIPMPGSKKSPKVLKANGNSANKINNRTGLVQNTNQNNNGTASQKEGTYGLKPGYGPKIGRSVIAPSEKPRSATAPPNIQKPNGTLTSFGYGAKPRTAPSKQSNGNGGNDSLKENEQKDANNNSSNAVNDTSDLHSSSIASSAPNKSSSFASPNGLGGGNVVKSGFSYHHGPEVTNLRKQTAPGEADSPISSVASVSESKLQPLGSPLNYSKLPQQNGLGKRSIPTPKGKLLAGKASSNSAPPSNGSDSSAGNSENENSNAQSSQASNSTAGPSKLGTKKNPPPPVPSRPKTPLTRRLSGQDPPPTAPKPNFAHLTQRTTGFNDRVENVTTESKPCEALQEEKLSFHENRPDLAMFSNIKRPESPERKATIYSRGNSARSLRKQMLKPVSIPQVPVLQSVRQADEVSKSDNDIHTSNLRTKEAGDKNALKKMSSAPDLLPDTGLGLINTSNAPSPSELKSTVQAEYVVLPTQNAESNNSEADSKKTATDTTSSVKRGFSSLKRFMPGRSSKQCKQLPSKTTESEVKPDSVAEKPNGAAVDKINENADKPRVEVSSPTVISSPALSNVHSLASMFENDSANAQENQENPALLQQSTPSLKKPTIPTTNLVTTLVKNSTDHGREKASTDGGLSRDCDTNTANGSVLRKSNLVKTGSYNSVNSSDSLTSNTSSSLSQQKQHSVQKKVSFQDNVMVSEGRGANTYVQRLKSKGDDSSFFEQTQVSSTTRLSAAEQLQIQATESDYNQYLTNHALTQPSTVNSAKRVLSPVGKTSVSERKSAVEAAIQNITGKPSSRKVTINDSYKAATQRPLTPSSHQFIAQQPPGVQMAVLSAGESDNGTLRYNHTSTLSLSHQRPYKEVWYPPYGQVSSSMPCNQYVSPSTTYEPYSTAVSAVEPSPSITLCPANSSGQCIPTPGTNVSQQSPIDQADLYFQIQSGFPYGNDSDKDEAWNFDPTPYYESCGDWTRGTSASTPIMANAESRQQTTDEFCSVKDKLRTATNGEGEGKVETGSHAREKDTQNRVKAMEQQIASLTGMVETIIIHTDKEVGPPENSDRDSEESSKLSANDRSASQNDDSRELLEVRRQMINLRSTAQELKKQLDELKRQQRNNLERMTEMIVTRTRELSSLITTTAGAEHAPVRARRLTLDRERSTYGDNASRTEGMLSDVEAAVEELRNEVVERRCRVNIREVEALALQLSQAGRTIADLKSSFPSLCEEMRDVGSAETEVIIQEEKFMDTEPARLDDQLKRCKQLTQTLYTLKKLATVQEARSKTPVNVLGGQSMAVRPDTPSQYLASLMSIGATSYSCRSQADEELRKTKNLILNDVRAQRVDSVRRMQSIQEAELRRTRRQKYTREYDSKKMEKALELAEKALRRTTNLNLVEKRQKKHFNDMLMNMNGTRQSGENKLTASLSESSSVESLPPPPPAMTSIKSNIAPLQSELPIYASSTCSMSTASSATMNPPLENLLSPDGGYISSEILSPQYGGMIGKHRSPKVHSNPPSTQQTGLDSIPYATQQIPIVNSNPDSRHYQYRSNSLQRNRPIAQRTQQQTENYDDFQRQRSRTPNPFPVSSVPYESQVYGQQQPTYQQQFQYESDVHYNLAETYQDPYTQQPQQYSLRYVSQNEVDQSYQEQRQFTPYSNSPRQQPQTQMPYQQPMEESGNVKSQPNRYQQRQLRRPTNFASKLPNPAVHRDSPPQYRSSPIPGSFSDDVSRRRMLEKQQALHAEKNLKLKEQYSKLQQLQRKQKMQYQVKNPPKLQQKRHPGMTPAVNPTAKSSDV